VTIVFRNRFCQVNRTRLFELPAQSCFKTFRRQTCYRHVLAVVKLKRNVIFDFFKSVCFVQFLSNLFRMSSKQLIIQKVCINHIYIYIWCAINKQYKLKHLEIRRFESRWFLSAIFFIFFLLFHNQLFVRSYLLVYKNHKNDNNNIYNI